MRRANTSSLPSILVDEDSDNYDYEDDDVFRAKLVKVFERANSSIITYPLINVLR